MLQRFFILQRVVEVAKRREGLHPERDRSRNKTTAPYNLAECMRINSNLSTNL